MEIKVLDNGYVKLIEAYGHGLDGVQNVNDEWNPEFDYNDYEVGIIEAARQSTQGSFRGWENGDEKLLGFMKRNHHDTPFEFAGMIIEVKAPIFVFREWHRHRTQSYNEMSARYAPLPDENYMPSLERLFLTQDKNKQAQGIEGAQELTNEQAENWLSYLDEMYDRCEELYQAGLSLGIPKEVARVILPVGRYSQMRASANLRNWFQFLSLRSSKSNLNAQYEIRMFADAVEEIIANQFPRSYSLFNEMRG